VPMTLLLAVLLLGTSLSGDVAAQSYPTITVTDRTRCTTCSMVVTRGPIFGTDDGDGMIEASGAVLSRDSRGRFYVLGNYPQQIKVYDARGRFLRTIGRSGEGPGEYKGISKVIPITDDSLLVLDQVLARQTVLDPEYRLVRTSTLPVGPEHESVRMPDGSLVVSVPIFTPDRIGLPLHRIVQDGTIARSFGSETGLFRPDVPWLDRRAISGHDSVSVWSAYHTQYVIEQYAVRSGALLRRIVREADWFPPNLRPLTKGQDPDQPQPFLARVHEGTDGLLWILVSVPDPNWREAIRPRGRQAPRHPSVRNEDGYKDYIIEVLEPETGRLLASHRFDRRVNLFGPGLVGAVTVADDGAVRLETWRLQLTRDGGSFR
jgi:hypothetical protein